MEERIKKVPEVVLNSGHKMPVLGLGTGKLPPTPTDVLLPILMYAIEVGYHHFDTAAFYQSEQAIGRAVVQALERGLIKSRDEIFITSKLWCTDASQSYSPCPQHHTPIIPRSIIQQGPSAVPRSFNKVGMKQNLEIFDWELGEDEMNKINQIPHCRLYAGDFFVYEVGPYKSLHQLWDGDH